MFAADIGASDRAAPNAASIERGQYIFAASDCNACHTDEKAGTKPLAGGPALATPFGIFFAPNITPDPQYGIGAWSEAEFRRALRDGKGRDGEYLYPVFPYTSFTKMTDQDIGDLYAYLMAQPAAPQPNKAHKPKFPFGIRQLLLGWRILFFVPGPIAPVDGQPAAWNRGRYLSESAAHCSECHTPRNFLGGMDLSRAYAGNPKGPDDQKAPNITPHTTGIGAWTVEQIEDLLNTGQTPEYDFVGSGMADVVKGTGQMTAADRHAIAVYIKSLPPLHAVTK